MLTARDMAILEYVAVARVVSVPHVQLALKGREELGLSYDGIAKRMRLLAKEGFLNAYYPANRLPVVYLSTLKGVSVTSQAGLVRIPNSNGLITSLAHCLLLSTEIAKVLNGDHDGFGFIPEAVMFTDPTIDHAVKAELAANKNWTPIRSRATDVLLEPQYSAIATYSSITIPDLVGHNSAEQHATWAVEVETSLKSARGYYERLVEGYVRAEVFVHFVVGNTNLNGAPLPAIRRRLEEAVRSVAGANDLVIIREADMTWACSRAENKVHS